jgi:hypothetical protein
MKCGLRASCGALVCGLALVAAGCRAPAQPAGATEMVLRILDYDAYVDASLSLLRLYDFPPDRVDRTGGLIVSKPTTSAQWFEWWRKDSPGAYQTLESSLHTIHRVVTVQMEPLEGRPETDAAGLSAPAAPATAATGAAEAPAPVQEEPATTAGRYRVSVRVDKSRLATVERQVTTASGALVLYSRRVPTVEGVKASPRDEQWVPLGRDGLLEADILERLANVLPGAEIAD